MQKEMSCKMYINKINLKIVGLLAFCKTFLKLKVKKKIK